MLTSNLGFDANIDQEGSYLAKSMSKEEPESACKLDIPADKANIFNSLLLMIHK